MMKKNNVIVSGYPKSGTTWATRLVAQLLDCPVKGFWGKDVYSIVSEGESRDSLFCCYQSHHFYDELSDQNGNEVHKIIYVIRDPRDIVVSGMYHFNFYPRIIEKMVLEHKVENSFFGRVIKMIGRKLVTKSQKINKMLETIKYGTPYILWCNYPWKEHVLSYLDKDVLVIKYEDLLNHSLKESKRILEFVSYQKNDNQILTDIQSQSFFTRKQEFELTGNKIKSTHLRKGKVGEWKYNLSKKQIRDIDYHMGELVQKLGYND